MRERMHRTWYHPFLRISMWSFNRKTEADNRRAVLMVSMGALSGLAIGLLFSRRGAYREAGYHSVDMRNRLEAGVGSYAQSGIADAVLEPELQGLEDAVLETFLSHEVLRYRGIDVGAISRGIVELSGMVPTEADAELAVRVANSVRGVQTVVNRLEVEDEVRHLEETRRRLDEGDPALVERHWEGRSIGMGRPRQGQHTEPDRPDDSQHRVERALAEADRDQWLEETGVHEAPRVAARPAPDQPGQKPTYGSDELDNQDPNHRGSGSPSESGQHELRAGDRGGDGAGPGHELRLEDTDIPLQPQRDVASPEERF